MKIFFDSRWIAPHGIGRVAAEYRNRLAAEFDVIEYLATNKPSSPMDSVRVAHDFYRSGADIFVTPGYNGTPLIGRKQVFIVHDLIHFSDREPDGTRKRLYYNTVTRLAARRGRILTVSEASAAEIEQLWPEQRGKVLVVGNGVASAFFKPVVPKSVNRHGLVLFANTRWQKNLPAMLAAARIWQDAGGAGADEAITIIGNPMAARGLVNVAGLRNVAFPGAIDDDALATLLRQSRALLFCSLREGFGLPVLESLACGCPVVASDIPVFREIAHQGCAFVDPASVISIAEGIGRAVVLKVEQATQERIASEFDWSRSYAKISALIRGLAADG
jgi:glycosyltransferase involved in cell wall biosynthesis